MDVGSREVSLDSLAKTAQSLLADHKGLLAMDESNGTCNKWFANAGIAQTEEARRGYRELIITTPGLSECVSGVILYDETIHQARADGTSAFSAATSPRSASISELPMIESAIASILPTPR